jgi:Trk K+ transport system NAD-binding subunit
MICGIIRHGETVLPRGDAVLQEADEIIALVDDDSRDIVANLLGRPKAN